VKGIKNNWFIALRKDCEASKHEIECDVPHVGGTRNGTGSRNEGMHESGRFFKTLFMKATEERDLDRFQVQKC
jgi:hypothetical protein